MQSFNPSSYVRNLVNGDVQMDYNAVTQRKTEVDTRKSDKINKVKRIEEHYQEVRDKIMSECFEEEMQVEKDCTKDDDSNDINEKVRSKDKVKYHKNNSFTRIRSNSWPTVSDKFPIMTEESMKKLNEASIRSRHNDMQTQTDGYVMTKNDKSDLSNEDYKVKNESYKTKIEDYRNENIHFPKYSLIAKENFHQLHRYYLSYTLPISIRNNILLEIRSLGVDRLNIGLFGPPGCGKSALLNTMYSVITSQYVEHSSERKLGKRYRQSVTNQRIELRLTENISVLDNKGINVNKASLLEVKKQCEGLREAEELIPPDWKSSISQKAHDVIKLCNKRILLRNRVHCPIIVTSITQQLDKNGMKRLVSTLKQSCYCNPVVVILTNIHDPESTRTYMAKSWKTFFDGLGCESVHELNVYTSSNNRHNLYTAEKIINILFECCLVGDKAISSTLIDYKKGACC